MQLLVSIAGLYPKNPVFMKNILLLAISLTSLASFGQDRKDGLVRLTNRNVAIDIHRDVIRIVKTDVNRRVSYHVLANGHNWRSISRYHVRSLPLQAAQYYPYGRASRMGIRSEIQREIRQTRNMVRQAIRSAFRFGRR